MGKGSSGIVLIAMEVEEAGKENAGEEMEGMGEKGRAPKGRP